METKDLLKLFEEYAKTASPQDVEYTLSKTSLDEIIADMESIRNTALTNSKGPIVSSTPVTSNVEPPAEYWTKTQWEFLWKCCNSNLRQYGIRIPAFDGGYYDFKEVVFETVLHSGFVIVAKLEADSMIYEIPSEHFKENHHIMPQWVKHLMRTVYDNWISSKRLEK